MFRYDYVISQKTETFCYAFSEEGKFQYHGPNKKTFTFDFVEGAQNEKKTKDTQREIIYFIHGIGLAISWTIFIDLAIASKKFLKHWKYSLEIHIVLAALISSFTAFAAVSMIILSNFCLLDFSNNCYCEICRLEENI